MGSIYRLDHDVWGYAEGIRELRPRHWRDRIRGVARRPMYHCERRLCDEHGNSAKNEAVVNYRCVTVIARLDRAFEWG
jgi:hypothetical protein